MSWESLLKRGRNSIDPSIRKPAIRKALMEAADSVGPQFSLPQIHKPFLENYERELREKGVSPHGAALHVKRYSEIRAFRTFASRYFNFIGQEKGVRIYERGD